MRKNESTSPPGSTLGGTDTKRLYRWLLLSCLLITCCLSALYYLNPRFVQFLSFKVTDTIQSSVTVPQSEMEMEVVAIDERSLEKYGQWPWPRYLIAQLLGEIHRGGATAVGIDILFPEQDRTSPTAWLQDSTEKFGVKLDTSKGPLSVLDFDSYLADTLSKGPFVQGYSFMFSSVDFTQGKCNLRPVLPNIKIRQQSLTPEFIFHKADGVVCNYSPLAIVAIYSGFLNASPDSDGSIRRLPLLIEFEGDLYPSFALATLMQNYPGSVPLIESGGLLEPATVSIAQHRIPMSNRGEFLLNPGAPGKRKYISAADILGKNHAHDTFKNKIVLVGIVASGLTQDFTTPFATQLSSLDLHRNSIESLTANLQTVRNPFFSVVEIGITLFLCFALLVLIYHLSSVTGGLCCLVTLCLSWVTALYVYKYNGLLFSPLLPISAILVNYFVLTTLKFKFSTELAHTEKGSALNLLQSSEENLQSILNTIPDIVFRLDQKGRITFISPAVSRYLEASSSLIGTSIFDLVAPEDIDKSQYRLNERRTGERATLDFEIKLLLTRNSGEQTESERHFSLSAAGLYASDHGSSGVREFLGTQAIVRDITDRKKLEHQLLQAQKMEVVGNLASGIAHDLNNILSGLVSYPDLLLLDIPRDDPLHKKISVIQRSGKKAAVIVQDLLTLARRNIKISELCNLNTIIVDYLDSVEFHLVQSNNPRVTIQTKLAEDLLNVKGSAAHLSKLIMNVLHNGVEAMPAGGDIFIETKNISLDLPLERYEKIPEGDYACVIVTDTGVGIAKEDLNRIFEPFYTKKSMLSSGTGIGMTIIWATIKDHHGYIDVNSKEGEGTTMTFYLPGTAEIIDEIERRVVLEDFIGSESILIIDDVDEQRNIGENMLSKLGYQVLTVGSGEEAIRLLKNQSVDLLILDMIMPGGLDGLSTYEAISEFSPGQKAIITSGFSESQRVTDLLKLGAGCFVQKPFTLEAIGVAVRRELDK